MYGARSHTFSEVALGALCSQSHRRISIYIMFSFSLLRTLRSDKLSGSFSSISVSSLRARRSSASIFATFSFTSLFDRLFEIFRRLTRSLDPRFLWSGLCVWRQTSDSFTFARDNRLPILYGAPGCRRRLSCATITGASRASCVIRVRLSVRTRPTVRQGFMPPLPSHFWEAVVFGLVPTTWVAKMGGVGCPPFLSQNLQVEGEFGHFEQI